MTYRIEIEHNFETAHRLYKQTASIKCQSLHGHSWYARLTVAADALDAAGMIIEFATLKQAWRGWIDTHLDHSLVLHRDDPMAAAVRSVFPESRITLLDDSPTTEVLAALLHQVATGFVAQLPNAATNVRVEAVHIQETRVNAASYAAD